MFTARVVYGGHKVHGAFFFRADARGSCYEKSIGSLFLLPNAYIKVY